MERSALCDPPDLTKDAQFSCEIVLDSAQTPHSGHNRLVATLSKDSHAVSPTYSSLAGLRALGSNGTAPATSTQPKMTSVGIILCVAVSSGILVSALVDRVIVKPRLANMAPTYALPKTPCKSAVPTPGKQAAVPKPRVKAATAVNPVDQSLGPHVLGSPSVEAEKLLLSPTSEHDVAKSSSKRRKARALRRRSMKLRESGSWSHGSSRSHHHRLRRHAESSGTRIVDLEAFVDVSRAGCAHQLGPVTNRAFPLWHLQSGLAQLVDAAEANMAQRRVQRKLHKRSSGLRRAHMHSDATPSSAVPASVQDSTLSLSHEHAQLLHRVQLDRAAAVSGDTGSVTLASPPQSTARIVTYLPR